MKPKLELSGICATLLRFGLALIVVLAAAVLVAEPLPAEVAVDEAAAEAQDDEEAEASEDQTEDTFGDVITVTSRRREENVQEVPIAVSVIQGEFLEETGAQTLSELETNVPNTVIYAGRNQTTTLTAFVRGIGQADPLWGVDPGVGLYLDDVYIARPQGALLDVFDVDRIEVLRGPQGTLYGKNTIGGAIKYHSRPATDTPYGRISITGGEHGTQEVRAAFSGPISEGKVRGKFAIASLERDGYGRNLFQNRDVSDRSTLAARAGLDFLISENVTLSLSADMTEDDAEPKGLTRLEANPLCPLFLGVPCPPLNNLFDTRSGLEPTNGTDSEGYSATLEWLVNDNWMFKSITAYRESDSENNIDFDTTEARITDVFANYFDDQFTQEFQFIYTSAERLNGILGLYYFDGHAGGLVRNIFLDGSPLINPLFGTTDGTTDTEQLAIFGDGTYSINDRTNFNFGLRLTEEEKRGVAFNAGYTDDTFTEVAVVTADYDQSETFTSVSPRLGVDYFFDDDVMGYITVSNGFKSGGFNVRAQATAFPESALPFDDEVLTVGEIGVKSVLADRRVILNVAAFYGDYSDIQVSTFSAYDSDGDGMDDAFFGNFLNAGDATISGLEVEYDCSFQSPDWLRLWGHVSYLDADPDSFLDLDGDTFVDTQVITNAPEFTGAINLAFNTPAWNGLISGNVGYSYRDDAILTNEGGPDPRDPTRPLEPITEDAYGLVNANVGWLSADAKWRFAINALNLTDEEYLETGYNIPVLGLLQGSFGAPRTITATVEFRFF